MESAGLAVNLTLTAGSGFCMSADVCCKAASKRHLLHRERTLAQRSSALHSRRVKKAKKLMSHAPPRSGACLGERGGLGPDSTPCRGLASDVPCAGR